MIQVLVIEDDFTGITNFIDASSYTNDIILITNTHVEETQLVLNAIKIDCIEYQFTFELKENHDCKQLIKRICKCFINKFPGIRASLHPT